MNFSPKTLNLNFFILCLGAIFSIYSQFGNHGVLLVANNEFLNQSEPISRKRPFLLALFEHKYDWTAEGSVVLDTVVKRQASVDTNSPKPLEPVFLPIITGTSPCYAQKKKCLGIDLSLDRDPTTFFHSASCEEGTAVYFIPPSTVTKVKILNRHDGNAERMTGEAVEVCKSQERNYWCRKCGNFQEVGKGQWGTMNCGDQSEGLQGSVVKVRAKGCLQIAQIEIYGITSRSSVRLSIRGAQCSSSDPKNALSLAYDHLSSTYFRSTEPKQGWAKFEIKKSFVRIVRLQNRVDKHKETFMGNIVSVCADDSDGSCRGCDRTVQLGGLKKYNLGDWVAMECNGDQGIKGRFVKVEAPNSHLQFAEIEIYANDLADSEGDEIQIIAGVASPCRITSPSSAVLPVCQTHSDLESSFDGDPRTFFQSMDQGSAKYFIPAGSFVCRVMIQSSANGGTALAGLEVLVCESRTAQANNECKSCGKLDAVANSAWGTATCPKDEEIRGNFVFVRHATSHVEIAEVRIYGQVTSHETIVMTPNISGSGQPQRFPLKQYSKLRLILIKLAPNNEDKIRGMNVSVCHDKGIDTEVCQHCGAFRSEPPVHTAEWVEVDCADTSGAGSPLPAGGYVTIEQSATMTIWDYKLYHTENEISRLKFDGAMIQIVTAVGSSCYEGNCSKYGVAKSLDEDPASIHLSALETGGWAKYFLPQSTVTRVNILNRADCCGELLAGVYVWVCRGAECTKCGQMANVDKGKWGKVNCGGSHGIRGSSVYIVNRWNRLQMAKVEVFGTTEGEPFVKVPIVEATSSPPITYKFPLAASFDQKEDTYFQSLESRNGWAQYKFQESFVRLVRIKNQPGYDWGGANLAGDTLSVCSTKSASLCTPCGRVTANSTMSMWVAVECNGAQGIQGRYVRVEATNWYLRIAEIEIYVNTFPYANHSLNESAPLHEGKIPILAGSGSKCYSDKSTGCYDIDRALDGDVSTFFQSGSHRSGWAKFFVPYSRVTAVLVQNRADCCDERLPDTTVEVCLGESCVECGKVGPVGSGSWGNVSCTKDNEDGHWASSVKLTQHSRLQPLQIAQIEIYGEVALGRRVVRVPIKDADCSDPFSRTNVLVYSYDQSPKTYFMTKLPKGGWASYRVQESYIRLVRLQNRADGFAARMTGNEVSVCHDLKTSCLTCERIITEPVETSQWVTVECNGAAGIRGKYVKVTDTDSFLQIAEIEIYVNDFIQIDRPITTRPAQRLQTSLSNQTKVVEETTRDVEGTQNRIPRTANETGSTDADPGSGSSEPATSGSIPEASSSQPATSGSNPEASSSQPATSGSNPEANSSQPATSGSNQEASTSQPATSGLDPEADSTPAANPDHDDNTDSGPKPLTTETIIKIVTATASKCLDDDIEKWGIQKTWDGNKETYYRGSPDVPDPKARFYIPSSVVTEVQIQRPVFTAQNRRARSTNTVLNVAIYVCESGYCESCAVVDVGSDDSWATGKCGVNDTGVTGTSVLIKRMYPRRHSTPNTQRYPPQFGPPPTPRNANSSHPDFEIAEIAIWGKESAPPVRLTVKEATSSPLAEDSDLRNAYDFDMSSVMKTKDQEEGWAMFHVKKSAIRLARVANITDEEYVENLHFFVCSEPSSYTCRPCDRLGEPSPLNGWAVVECGGGRGIEGSYVRVEVYGRNLILSDIDIFGMEISGGSLARSRQEQLQIITAMGSECYKEKKHEGCWDIDLSLDKDPDTKYHTRAWKNGWALYYIPPSSVTSVMLLNRKDCCGSRLAGKTVWVCEKDNCQKCGDFPDVAEGQWYNIPCGADDGIRGSSVKVVQTTDESLQIAKMEIYGVPQMSTDSIRIVRLPIKSANSSPPYVKPEEKTEADETTTAEAITTETATPEEPKPNEYDVTTSYDGNATSFFTSNDTTGGWAEYEIQWAHVRIVRLQNRADCCPDRMKGNKVYVCPIKSNVQPIEMLTNNNIRTSNGTNLSSCSECGSITHTVAMTQWAAVECKNDTQGSYVKVISENTYLQIAEIEIYGFLGDDKVEDKPRNAEEGVDGGTVGSVAEAGSIN